MRRLSDASQLRSVAFVDNQQTTLFIGLSSCGLRLFQRSKLHATLEVHLLQEPALFIDRLELDIQISNDDDSTGPR